MKGKLFPAQIEALVRDALALPPESSTVIAARHGVTRQTVSLIRNDKIHRLVLPDLPRGMAGRRCRRCRRCVHWRLDAPEGVNPCRLGMPEAQLDDQGERAAMECGAYHHG